MQKKELVIYWSRKDFRLHDNPALSESLKYAKENDAEFLPIFILEDYMRKAQTNFQFGYPQRYFLSQALPRFANNFDKFLIIKDKGAQTFKKIVNELCVGKDDSGYRIKLFVNEDVYIDFYKQINKLKLLEEKVGKENFEINILDDMLSINKEIKSGTGNYYSVFTPFKKAVWSEFVNKKVYTKANVKNVVYISDNNFKNIKNIFEDNILEINSDNKNKEINTENILNSFSENRKFKAGNHTFDIGEVLANTKQDLSLWDYDEESVGDNFDKYLKHNLANYKKDRDSLELDLTSKMSPALSWGLISARMLKDKIVKHFDYNFEDIFKLNMIPEKYEGATHYISELVWREFYKYLFYHNHDLMHTEFQEKFRNKIKWVSDDVAKKRFESWIKGETGYKVVDAAMMQLAKTGWMHNRSRMIVASVLTKNFGVNWRWGQEYFRAMLIDLDEASNCGGWQWGASVGADPKPIRIFNPYLQAENYDKNNIYQNKWLSDSEFYNENGGVFAPAPIVEHKLARAEAMARYGLNEKSDGIARDY